MVSAPLKNNQARFILRNHGQDVIKVVAPTVWFDDTVDYGSPIVFGDRIPNSLPPSERALD